MAKADKGVDVEDAKDRNVEIIGKRSEEWQRSITPLVHNGMYRGRRGKMGE